MCITDYDLLQMSDFFGSACSLWFTLVAMASIRKKHVAGLLQIVGVFGLFIIIVYDKSSLCVIAIPIFSGLATITCSWGVKMYRRKHLYPSWRRYVFYLVPGVVLAVIGGVSFAFLETESNYKYLHSLWHVCVALSIVLLLPPKSGGKGEICGVSESTVAMSQLPTVPFSEDVS
ncbi:transmembrane protein 8A [Elysia marginata]|uniref:Transmembrane protein 8A n=1 Tax=Elysia marginata TaxID=1093978 RepID=A0AAV4IZY6_9GAST|nr:transmembrane protein 8A [Elysia marginata]